MRIFEIFKISSLVIAFFIYLSASFAMDNQEEEFYDAQEPSDEELKWINEQMQNQQNFFGYSLAKDENINEFERLSNELIFKILTDLVKISSTSKEFARSTIHLACTNKFFNEYIKFALPKLLKKINIRALLSAGIVSGIFFDSIQKIICNRNIKEEILKRAKEIKSEMLSKIIARGFEFDESEFQESLNQEESSEAVSKNLNFEDNMNVFVNLFKLDLLVKNTEINYSSYRGFKDIQSGKLIFFQDELDVLLCAALVIPRSNFDFLITVLFMGVDINNLYFYKFGDSALGYAVRSNKIDIAKLLIEAGANVDSKNKQMGETPLMIACKGDCKYETQYMRIVEMLIGAGSDVNMQDKWGKTALLHSLESGNIIIAQVLLEAEADVNLTTKYLKLNALMIALMKGHSDIAKKVIKDYNADIHCKDSNGWSALMFATEKGDTENVKILLSKWQVKAEIWSRKDSWWPRLKFYFRIDLNAKDKIYYTTALMLAAQNGYDEIVRMLLDAGADVNAKNFKGITAKILAKNNGHNNIAHLLSQYKK